MVETPGRFAFGTEHVRDDGNDYACVAAAAGYSMSSDVLELAERYDDACRERTGDEYGTVDADTAEKIWNEIIGYMYEQAEDKRERGFKNRAEQIESIASTGEEIAEKIF